MATTTTGAGGRVSKRSVHLSERETAGRWRCDAILVWPCDGTSVVIDSSRGEQFAYESSCRRLDGVAGQSIQRSIP